MLLDPEQNTLTIANAGHLPPLLRKKDGEIRVLAKETSSLPLGIMPELTYGSTTIDIAAGDTILAFTDGVTEAMNEDREIYGSERLTRLLSKLDLPVGEIISQIVENVETFTGDATLRDDTCIIGLHRSAT
jgi:serine phosphatase RsbU (regulator of sigma subunit)